MSDCCKLDIFPHIFPRTFFDRMKATAETNPAPAIRCGLDFFGADHVLFGTDCPFEPKGGPMFIRESIRAIDSLKLSVSTRNKVYFGNAIKMLRLDPALKTVEVKPVRRKKVTKK